MAAGCPVKFGPMLVAIMSDCCRCRRSTGWMSTSGKGRYRMRMRQGDGRVAIVVFRFACAETLTLAGVFARASIRRAAQDAISAGRAGSRLRGDENKRIAMVYSGDGLQDPSWRRCIGWLTRRSARMRGGSGGGGGGRRVAGSVRDTQQHQPRRKSDHSEPDRRSREPTGQRCQVDRGDKEGRGQQAEMETQDNATMAGLG